MTIGYEDFTKVDIRVGTIVDVQPYPEARKPAYKLTIDVMVDNMLAHDAEEGIGAFIEKREPKWLDK